MALTCCCCLELKLSVEVECIEGAVDCNMKVQANEKTVPESVLRKVGRVKLELSAGVFQKWSKGSESLR